jgi:hypothetical protein
VKRGTTVKKLDSAVYVAEDYSKDSLDNIFDEDMMSKYINGSHKRKMKKPRGKNSLKEELKYFKKDIL